MVPGQVRCGSLQPYWGAIHVHRLKQGLSPSPKVTGARGTAPWMEGIKNGARGQVGGVTEQASG